MVSIKYKGQIYTPREGETLLKMFLRRGVKVPYSCGGGACHFCMHRCSEGTIPEPSQRSLRPIYKDNNFFLLCCCVPKDDMSIELPPKEERFCQMEVVDKNEIDGDFCVDLMSYSSFRGRKGQFLLLLLPNNQRISARLISDTTEDCIISLSFKSQNSEKKLAVGDCIEVQGPFAASPSMVDMEEGLTRNYPQPAPDLWVALDNGHLLTEILKVFYRRVFRDPILAPYFESVTERRLVEKQYNFLSQAITGEKVYFGEKPRNSHHWMVISDETLDHRMKILYQVMVEFSIPENIIQGLVAIEEYYRKDIVKNKPWEKILFGKALPVEGYEPLVLDEASLCDGCNSSVEKGESITYHVRTGHVYCIRCRQD